MTVDRPVGGTLMLRSDHDAEVARLEYRLRLVSDDRDQLAQLLGQALVEHYEAQEAKSMHKERADNEALRVADLSRLLASESARVSQLTARLAAVNEVIRIHDTTTDIDGGGRGLVPTDTLRAALADALNDKED